MSRRLKRLLPSSNVRSRTSSTSLSKRSTGVVLPQLRSLFLAREQGQRPRLPEGVSPDKYRQEHGRCPPGYHIDEETGKCITTEDLISKLQKQKEETSHPQPPQQKEPPKRNEGEDEEHPPLAELRSREDHPDYDDILDSCRSKFSAMAFVPKGVRKALSSPFKFLGDRYRKGKQKWSDAVAKEEAELQARNKGNPFFSTAKLDPEEEAKAIKRMNSAWHRWGHALNKTYGKAASWLAKRGPKGAAVDIASGIGKATSFVGRRIGDVAEVLGGVVQKHKVVGGVISKIVAGRFDEITPTEKIAAYEVGIEVGEVALLTLVGGHAMKSHSSVHQKALEHASEAASATEASMGEMLVSHASEMSDETASLASEAAAVTSTLGHAAHKYLGTIEVVAKVRAIDSIAHSLVKGEHLEGHGKKHAALLTAEEKTKAASSFFARKMMEHLLEGLKDYKPSQKDVFRGMKAASDVLRIHHLAKLEKKGDDEDGKEGKKMTSPAPEVSEGIIDKMEKTSMVRPGKRDYYDYRAMKKLAASFRKAMKKVVGKLYEETWMNSPPHSEEDTVRNFGDVVVELKNGFQGSPNWQEMKKRIADLILSYERDYPGITFSFTAKGRHKSVISANAHKYHYPQGDEGIHYVYHVDSLVSWW